MHMFFWWSYNVSDYLFKGLTAYNVWGLFAMCCCVATMSFLFEFLRYLQAKQRQKELTLRSEQIKSICPSDSATLLTGTTSRTNRTRPTRPIKITLLDRSILFGSDLSIWFSLQNLGYILMLSVMTYSGWLFISAVIGGGLGYFIFGQMFMKINLQNCQIIRDTFCMQKCGEPETSASSRDGESTPTLEVRDASNSVVYCHEVTVSVHAECDNHIN